MRAQRKKALIAAAVLVGLATASIPSFAGDEAAARSTGLADRRGRIQGQEALAEYYLSRLAKRSKTARTIGGGLGLALGAVCIGGGIAMLNEDDEDDWLCLGELFGTLAVATGGLACVGGIFSLAVPHASERSYKRVRDIADPGERETACADALAGLAKKGRRSRMIGGGLLCAMGVAGVIASGDDDSSGPLLSAAVAGGLALYVFLVKSPAERTYRAYLERSGVKPVPDLVLGFGPRGGFRAGLSLDF